MDYQSFESPNLDCENEESLRNWANIFRTLARFCECKRIAQVHRLEGNTSLAKGEEDRCEDLYQVLPAEVRW